MTGVSVFGMPRVSRLSHVVFVCLLFVPALALAQGSPFLTGANSLVANLQTWLTPVAVLLLIGAAFFAMANRISWAWPLSIMAGIVIGFGAPQLVAWVRGMFAV